MNYFPPTELLGACIKAGTKFKQPDTLGACVGGGGSGTEIALLLGTGIGGLLLIASVASVISYVCFRLIPRYSVRGNEWARKEALSVGVHTVALLLVLIFVGLFSTSFF